VAGGKMKEAGYAHWKAPNTDADNSSGFRGLPAGFRYFSLGGTFDAIGYYGYTWSSSEYSDNSQAWRRLMGYSYPNLSRHYSDKNNGFVVRCLKD